MPRLLALPVALAALLMLLVGAWSAAQLRGMTHARPWFVEPSGLAVADDGMIFVGVDESEVQVYAPDGRPVRAWLVEQSGPFRLEAGGGVVWVATEAGAIFEYDVEGNLLVEREDPSAYAEIGAANDRQITAGGVSYALEDDGLARVAPPPRELLAPLPVAPLAWFGAHPLYALCALLLGAPAGFVLAVALLRQGHDQGIGPS